MSFPTAILNTGLLKAFFSFLFSFFKNFVSLFLVSNIQYFIRLVHLFLYASAQRHSERLLFCRIKLNVKAKLSCHYASKCTKHLLRRAGTIGQHKDHVLRKSRDDTDKKTCVIVDNDGDDDDERLAAQTQYNIDLLDIDGAVVMFWFLFQSGLLDKQHVFHQQVDTFCRRSLRSIFPVKAF